MKRQLDHIVYCVKDLEEAVEVLHEKLGVRPIIGGRHLSQGTKNALVNLGDACYLEILAIDHENKDIEAPRWMGIDLISNNQVTRWALKTDDAAKDAKIVQGYNSEMGKIKAGSRNKEDGTKLEWDLIMPLSHPAVELIPFMTDWNKSNIHPTDSLAEGCRFISLELYHTDPNKIRPILHQFNDNIDLKKGEKNAIYLNIKSPKGIVKL